MSDVLETPVQGQSLGDKALQAACLASQALFQKQDPEGYWCGDLTADSTLQSDYILLQMWLHPAASDGSWNPPTMPKIRKAVRSILDAQRADGGWNIYEPGPSELNATVRAYTMLKMTGTRPQRAAHEACPRSHSSHGRNPGVQQLHQAQLQPVRSFSAQVRAHHSAGNPDHSRQRAL